MRLNKNSKGKAAQRDLTSPLLGVKKTYRCYIELPSVLELSPEKPFRIRDKVTDKEIMKWHIVRRIDGQRVEVMNRNKDMYLTQFVNNVLADERLRQRVQNRKDDKVWVTVTGVFLSEDDKQINLLRPTYQV